MGNIFCVEGKKAAPPVKKLPVKELSVWRKIWYKKGEAVPPVKKLPLLGTHAREKLTTRLRRLGGVLVGQFNLYLAGACAIGGTGCVMSVTIVFVRQRQIADRRRRRPQFVP